MRSKNNSLTMTCLEMSLVTMMTHSPFMFKIKITKPAFESKTILTTYRLPNSNLIFRGTNSMTHWKAIKSKWCSQPCKTSQRMENQFMKGQTLLEEMTYHNTQMITKHFTLQKCECSTSIITMIRKAKKYLRIIIIHWSILIAVSNPKFLKKFPRRCLSFLIIKKKFKIGN